MNRIRLSAAWLMSLAGGPALAAPCAAPPPASDVKAALIARYPASHISTVRESGLPGIYEVTLGRKVAYSDATGRYLLFGHIFDLARNRDLTAERMQDPAKVDVGLIQPDAYFSERQAPKANKSVYVFSDPRCIHCQRLEQSLAGLTDVDVRVIMLPLQPGSMATAESIWCAPDRAAAWRGWMLNGVMPAAASAECQARAKTQLEANIRLARQFGMLGTPGFIAMDGRTAMGAMDKTGLIDWLSSGPPDTTSTAVSEVNKVDK